MSPKNEQIEARAAVFQQQLSPYLDVPVNVTIDVGRTRLRVGELLNLTPGTVIELKKMAGEPFDVSVNGQTVARGEVIVVEQSAGVRIVEVPKQGN